MRVFFHLNVSKKEIVVSSEEKESPWQRMGSDLAGSDQGSFHRQERWLRG